jgi:DNA helicase-2/ATP-dependent DNA helicase PcrA
MFKPRPAQEEILKYTGGRMGVSAVPGSGKTNTLAYLAAQLVKLHVRDDQEVLIVTFTNSGVDNFYRRIREFLKIEQGLIPDVGYRVRTLHGLANDIIHERPALLGLPEDFQIADEREANQILDDIVTNWVRVNTETLEEFIAPDVSDDRRRWIERERWPELVRSIAASFIRRAKDLQATPAELRLKLPDWHGDWRLARMGLEIYEDYQRALAYRGQVDFDDLVRLALEALQIDPALTARLRARWPYILEDEAQDSSELQEKILRILTSPLAPLLVGEGNNWVRVGDPNQSINTTFTTSDIRFLNRFLDEEDVATRPLLYSGRSTRRIIDLANYLVDWTAAEHPHAVVRQEAFRVQHIELTPPDDPQPNPPDTPDLTVALYNKSLSPDKELELVVNSLERWLPDHADQTVAVLVPDNSRGYKLVERLERKQIPHDDHLNTTAPTRKAADVIGSVLRYLAAPLNGPLLSAVYKHWAGKEGEGDGERLPPTKVSDPLAGISDPLARIFDKAILTALRRCDEVEAFLWPRPDRDWLADVWATHASPIQANEEVMLSLTRFREVVRRWLNASALPIDQLVLTLAQDLYRDPADLALAHKIALVLRGLNQSHREWRLRELAEELSAIARNQQRFVGFSDDDQSFTPKPGKVTITTMHKAKGLEWDRVYLVGVNNYDFPSVQAHDSYRGETWFIRNSLNLEAEVIAQLEALKDSDPRKIPQYVAGPATYRARIEYTEERLRLLYVGITRAKKELIVTWNVGGFENAPKQAAAPFLALYTYLVEHSRGS